MPTSCYKDLLKIDRNVNNRVELQPRIPFLKEKWHAFNKYDLCKNKKKLNYKSIEIDNKVAWCGECCDCKSRSSQAKPYISLTTGNSYS